MYSDIYYNYKYRFVQEQNLLKAPSAFAVLCTAAPEAQFVLTFAFNEHIPDIRNGRFGNIRKGFFGQKRLMRSHDHVRH